MPIAAGEAVVDDLRHQRRLLEVTKHLTHHDQGGEEEGRTRFAVGMGHDDRKHEITFFL
jgi:hypothetical protein